MGGITENKDTNSSSSYRLQEPHDVCMWVIWSAVMLRLVETNVTVTKLTKTGEKKIISKPWKKSNVHSPAGSVYPIKRTVKYNRYILIFIKFFRRTPGWFPSSIAVITITNRGETRPTSVLNAGSMTMVPYWNTRHSCLSLSVCIAEHIYRSMAHLSIYHTNAWLQSSRILRSRYLKPLLLTWINFNPSIDM